MPPPTSAVWKYFKRNNDGNTVKCTLCSQELKMTGGTSNMRNYLKGKHPSHETGQKGKPVLYDTLCQYTKENDFIAEGEDYTSYSRYGSFRLHSTQHRRRKWVSKFDRDCCPRLYCTMQKYD